MTHYDWGRPNFIWNRYMGIGVERDILGFKGQRVNHIRLDC